MRELVKERVIYQRERAVGMSRSAYLMSKVVVLGTITVLQAVVLTLVALLGVDLGAPGGEGVLMPPLVEITAAVALLAFTAMMLGLVVSALVRKEEVTMPLLVLLAIVQVVFCGALLRAGRRARSRTAGLAGAVPVGVRRDGGHDRPRADRARQLTNDPLFAHTAGVWLLDMGMLVVLSLRLRIRRRPAAAPP